ncbi:bcl-2-like protein 12 [Myxocyprinus asiaticus]|uniref:bcl-2-like protein 12 n=1 Tax=Myxocyprinus asiaticus TaxID=70543 RepID=UPI0022225C80|nr:bcl-2-like protein 12 [Myxocyprinus asiaticus]XP_051570548.1 bcl-2-like protein 12 [Myxocyprinus asiaticus]XP_051570549.1 bcl-2-like protein 12 [Myxocyprinus asiaticus]XP_051570550.1 bcl-2-like protein 12 [Myxocyprinus asiaticus]XP_051570551.1 bcl-2-like protein 12 [Myxocyprinus asiaticus]
MANVGVRPASPTPSISLLEIKTETRLVLKSFLRHSLSIPPGERPGRIGGEYKDPNKYSAAQKKLKKDVTDAWDSLDEEISAVEEKKHGIKNLIKRRLRPRSSMIRHAKNDTSGDQTQNNTLEKQSQSGRSDKVSRNGASSLPRKSEEERLSPSSASEEEGKRKPVDKNKKKKKKLKISDILKKVSFKKEEPRPQRPATLPLRDDASFPEPAKPAVSPSHPPEFYDGVAETLDRIAQKHSVKKKSPIKPDPVPCASKDNHKEAVVQQLVQILTAEGDAINEKINTNSFLRSTLNRISYPSFAKLLDTYASQSEEPPLPAPVSPTLRRLAITMDVSRRVVTATGVQRLTGYAERYMESFAPWVRSHGGWGNIAQFDDVLECD